MIRFFFALAFFFFGLPAQEPILGSAIRAYFSPYGSSPTKAIVEALDNAQASVRVF
jgi:hypothetical protein